LNFGISDIKIKNAIPEFCINVLFDVLKFLKFDLTQT
jgi:hypothetical protein